MITINGIPDINRFFNAVDHCSGPVIAEFPEIGRFDLRESKTIREALNGMKQGYQGSFSMKVASAADMITIIDYMAHSYC